MTSRHWLTPLSALVLTGLVVGYASIWLFAHLDPAALTQMGFVPLVGVLGAIIANTSGTGGGVVFIPVFNVLRAENVLPLTPESIVGASFLIQCFGMTMGALTWLRATHTVAPVRTGIPAKQFWQMIGLVLLVSAPVMLATQRFVDVDARTSLLAFKAFSVALGAALLALTWTFNRNAPERMGLNRADVVVLCLLSALGGFATALFSVGTGELLALYLFLRHFPLNTCSASAVIASSASVLMGGVHHILGGTVPWEVVALAAPGAILGGFLARRIAHWLGPLRLKTLVGLWIVCSGLFLIVTNIH